MPEDSSDHITLAAEHDLGATQDRLDALAADPESPSDQVTAAQAAYEAEYGPESPASGPVWQPGDYPAPEPPATPYELDLTGNPEATWDDPDLAGPADREAGS